MTQQQSLPVGTAPLIVGVDVGGTKIAAGVVDTNGHIYGRVKLPTDTSQPEMTLHSVAAAINATLEAAGVEPAQLAGIGLGVPGQVDPAQGIVLLAVNLGWHNVPVKFWLEEQFGISCEVENDVSAACLGESLYGTGRGVRNMLYLSLGTGIAARMLIEGRLYRGTNGMAGELGHAIFVPNGPRCNCGANGCLEALASGPALVRLAHEKLATGQASLLRDLPDYPSTLAAEQVCEAATREDDLAWQTLNEVAAHLGYAIHLLAMAFDPQCIILGGGMAQEGPLLNAIRAAVVRLAEQSPIFREILPQEAIRLSSLKLDAGILGAASLVSTRLKLSKSEV